MLETASLILLPYEPQQLLALIEAPETFQELVGFPAAEGLRGFLVSSDVSAEFLSALRSGNSADPWIYGFAVVHGEEKCVVGNGAFKGPPDQNGTVEIAYGIVPAFQGLGYATEVSRALVDFAFRSEAVRSIRAHTSPLNNASTRVLLKCGFRHVGQVEDPDDGLVWRWELARPVHS